MARYVKQAKVWLGASVFIVALALPAAAASLSGQAAAQRTAAGVMRDHDFSSSIRAREPGGARARAPLDRERDRHLGRKRSRRVFLPGLYYVPGYDPSYDDESDVPLGPETAGPDNPAPPPPESEKPAESKTVRIPSGARFMPIPGAVSAPDISDDQSLTTGGIKSPRRHLLARQARSPAAAKDIARKRATSEARDAAQ